MEPEDPGEYDAYPDHPLYRVDPRALEVARQVLADAAQCKDVDPDMAEAIADAVVSALRSAGLLREPTDPT